MRVVRGGVTVLPGLSLVVPKGSVTGLLGPSGCGKSTLMRAIVGTQLVASGEVTVLGLPAGSRLCAGASATSRRRRRCTAT
jgi:ABC-2 type transport system ATP-binding protein